MQIGPSSYLSTKNPTKNNTQVNKEEEAVMLTANRHPTIGKLTAQIITFVFCMILLCIFCIKVSDHTKFSLPMRVLTRLAPWAKSWSLQKLLPCALGQAFIVKTSPSLHDNTRPGCRCSQQNSRILLHQNNSGDSSFRCLMLCQQTPSGIRSVCRGEGRQHCCWCAYWRTQQTKVIVQMSWPVHTNTHSRTVSISNPRTEEIW